MLKKLLDLLSNFFNSIFGKKKTTETTKPKKEKPVRVIPPKPTDDDLHDGSEVPVDTIVVVNEMDVDDSPIEVEEPEPPVEASTTTTTEPQVEPGASDGGDTSGEEPSAPEPPAEPEKKGRYLWCLDNGHGVKQAGKRSPKFTLNGKEVQLLEYEFNRDVVQRIMKALDEAGVAYFDVVPNVEEVGSFLPERVGLANDKDSDLPKLYISVHANAGPVATSNDWTSGSISGIETWFHHKSKSGKKMAAIFQKKLIEKTGLKNRHLKSTKERMLYVLKHTRMPAILTENAFYNNKIEVKKLMSDSMRQKIADAHIEAILEIEEKGL